MLSLAAERDDDIFMSCSVIAKILRNDDSVSFLTPDPVDPSDFDDVDASSKASKLIRLLRGLLPRYREDQISSGSVWAGAVVGLVEASLLGVEV